MRCLGKSMAADQSNMKQPGHQAIVGRRHAIKFAAACVGAFLGPCSGTVAQDEGAQERVEEIVVLGSRRAERSVADLPVPVDLISSVDLAQSGSGDMDDLLRTLLPSYNVQRFAIADAATIIRPATLRGLPPDNTLILINGKRRHRGSVIAEGGGSLTAGSQGPDLAVIPALAIDQVEVLRDGAAAQYGSDAIAGVINYRLKENRQGFVFESRWGETYAGDGDAWSLGANLGLPLGDQGFASISARWASTGPTSRSLPRTDAQALLETGNSAIMQPVQIWGAPDVEDDLAIFVNAGMALSDNQELYAFGNYAQRAVTGGFFFRNPNSRSGVFTRGGQRAIMDTRLAGQAGQISNCPVLLSPGGTPTDQDAVDADRAALAALPANCWVANNLYPGGYTPSFGGDNQDFSALAGLRGSLSNGFAYDLSLSIGRNETAFRIENTWNPSLGPDSPTAFDLGVYRQTERNYHADFLFPLPVAAFASDLNLAFGAEYRVETFEIALGEEDSWRAGPYALQNANFHSDGVTPLPAMTIGAHGFPGFNPSQAGEFDRGNYAIYADVGADLTPDFLLDTALRFEDFDDFGATLNGKVQARWHLTPSFGLRGSFSTGFRAPTPGQSNVEKVSTRTIDGQLLQSGQIRPTNPIAAYLGGEALDAEAAVSLTAGTSWDISDAWSITLDWFRIEVHDRISSTGLIDIRAESAIPDCPAVYAAAGNLAECLQELGVPGASDLSSVQFYTNDFDTRTQGIDAVLSYAGNWGATGMVRFTAAWNWTDTKVQRAGQEVSRNHLLELENYNPKQRAIFTLNYALGDLRLLFRSSYYGDWVVANDSASNSDPAYSPGTARYRIDCGIGPSKDHCYDGGWVFDLEAAYAFDERFTLAAGASNIFNNAGPRSKYNTFPDPNFSDWIGEKYTESVHWGFDGGFYYFRLRAEL